jgi:3-dehydroquinate dehydratase type II
MQSPSHALVINGPNLNLLGTRRPDIYGSTNLADLEAACRTWSTELGIQVDTYQSNHEGAIIDRLHRAREDVNAIVINPGAFTHYSYALYDALEAVEIPTVEVHISDVTRREAWRQQSVIAPACVATIYGRGTDGYRDALRHLVYRAAIPPATLAYGPHPDQVGDLRIPNDPGRCPVVALIHGGFWRKPWQRDLMDGLAVDLTRRGVATWNFEYRRGGGAWRDAYSDTAAGIDHLAVLATDHPLNLDRVALVGHSAGGQLALWAAGRTRLPDDSSWTSPVVTPHLSAALAGVVDLTRAMNTHLGDDAVQEFFGGPPDDTTLLDQMHPLGVPQLVAHGTADERVPTEHSRDYVEQARARGAAIEYLEFEGADHTVLIDEQSSEWDQIAGWVINGLSES